MGKIREELNSAFAAFHDKKWNELPEDKRNEFLDKLEKIVTDPKKDLELFYLDQGLQEFKIKYWDSKLLLVGVILGVSGNLFANLLDRYFTRFGYVYDLIIILALFATVFFIGRFIFRIGQDSIKAPIAKELRNATKDLFD
ncbi:MAG: hypothetical protein UY65_C0011G0007 [Parcubacteria group bacterium GW2011_GWA2_51_12]|nr:MAG: hypothetical protein UY65_C0011G0007 [Parcubacteria group bacterium GW2011_GWA2_51_12]